MDLLSQFNKVPVVNAITIKAGDFSRVYNVKATDPVIAAAAFAMKADLVTRDVEDYKKIKKIAFKVPY